MKHRENARLRSCLSDIACIRILSCVISCSAILASVILNCTSVILTGGKDLRAMKHAIKLERNLSDEAEKARAEYMKAIGAKTETQDLERWFNDEE